MMEVSWVAIKNYIALWGVGLLTVEDDENILIFASHFSSSFYARIKKSVQLEDLADFDENYRAIANTTVAGEVVTQFEKNDKVLKLASATGSFEANEARCAIVVPSGGRHIAGGYGWSDKYFFGDRIREVNVLDLNDVLGYGASAVVKTYHDVEVEDKNKGWRLYPAHQDSGEIEIDPIGGYGFIPEGFALEIVFEKVPGSSASFVACDIWWGKTE
jgi:hypothetical protein